MKNILLPLLLAAFGACHSGKKMPAPDSKLVQLETHGCRGFCPVYRLTFWNDGRAEFEGKHFTAQTGLHKFNLTKSELAEIQALVRQTNLWQYPDRIESTVADAPGATLTAFDGERSKSVQGTIDRPKPLLELEVKIKSLAEAHGLQVMRGVDPNTPLPGSRSEILLQLDEKENAGNWLAKIEGLKLQLLRRIPPANTWVVAFDSGQIGRKELVEMLQKMDGCKAAQLNSAVQERH